MATEQTLSIIKPDATRRNLTGKINARFEEAGLRIIAQRRVKLTREQAERFYEVHRERPFFKDLCAFMTSGPVVVQESVEANSVHGSDSLENAKREIGFFFAECDVVG